MSQKSYHTITIFVMPHPTVGDSFALTPTRYYGDDYEYDFDDTQEYRGLDLALSNAVSLKQLYTSQHPNASIVIIDHQGNEYP